MSNDWIKNTVDRTNPLEPVASILLSNKTVKCILNSHLQTFLLVLVYPCSACGKVYKRNTSLWRHRKFECQKEPTFKCEFCVYKSKQKAPMVRHMTLIHGQDFLDSALSRISRPTDQFE